MKLIYVGFFQHVQDKFLAVPNLNVNPPFSLNNSLQRRDIDVFEAYTMNENIKSGIQCLRDEIGVEFQIWYDEAKYFKHHCFFLISMQLEINDQSAYYIFSDIMHNIPHYDWGYYHVSSNKSSNPQLS